MSVYLELFEWNNQHSKKSKCVGGLSIEVLNQYVMLPPEIQRKWEHLLTANVSRREKELRLRQLKGAKEIYNETSVSPNNVNG